MKRWLSDLFKLIVLLIFLVALLLASDRVLEELSKRGFSWIKAYFRYMKVIAVVVLGYPTIHVLSNMFYSRVRESHDARTAAVVRNTVRILGVGFLLVIISSMLVNPTIAVTLSGFLGIVFGYSCRDVFSQALAGIVLLTARPVRVNDYIVVQGLEGRVEEISLMFTTLKMSENNVVMIPNDQVLRSSIVLLRR